MGLHRSISVRPREGGDPGRHTEEFEQVALGPRFREDERLG